jgi:hypothetical protein
VPKWAFLSGVSVPPWLDEYIHAIAAMVAMAAIKPDRTCKIPSHTNLASMVALCPEMYKSSTTDEGKILKLVEDHLLPSCAMLQGWPAKCRDTPTTKIS